MPYLKTSTCLLQAVLAVAALKDERLKSKISSGRLFDCVNVILSYQNPSGGWATYENTRSFAWVEVSDSLSQSQNKSSWHSTFLLTMNIFECKQYKMHKIY